MMISIISKSIKFQFSVNTLCIFQVYHCLLILLFMHRIVHSTWYYNYKIYVKNHLLINIVILRRTVSIHIMMHLTIIYPYSFTYILFSYSFQFYSRLEFPSLFCDTITFFLRNPEN